MVALVFVGFSGLGVYVEVGESPETKILRHEEISSTYINWFTENNILEEGERVDYFYSAAVLSFKKDGNLLTNRRVISYYEDGKELIIAYAYFDEITSIIIEEKSSILLDATVKIEYAEEEEPSDFIIFLS